MEKKNREVRILVDKYKSGRDSDAKPLTMCINGTVDAVVQGGIKKYEEAFFIDEYFRNNPQEVDNITYLKRTIVDQVRSFFFFFLLNTFQKLQNNLYNVTHSFI